MLRSVRSRRIHTSNGAISSCRACARRASTSSTRTPTRRAAHRARIEPEEIIQRAGYTRPHTVHCGPDAIYISALGNAERRRTGRHLHAGLRVFDVIGPWEVDRGPQYFAYDFWWHLTQT